MKVKHLSILVASVFLTVGAAQAASLANDSWYVLPQVGAFVPDSDVEAKTGFFGGVKLGKQLNKNFDVQIGAQYGSVSEDAAAYSSGDYSQFALTVDSLWIFNRDGAFRPFVSAGVGLANDKLSYTANKTGAYVNYNNLDISKSSLFGSLGAGVQYAWSTKNFVQADVRWGTSSPDDDGTVRQSDAAKSAQVDLPKLSNLYLGLAVGYHFGEPSVAPAPRQPVVEIEPEPAPIVAVAGVKPCEDDGSCVVVVAQPKVEQPVVVKKDVLKGKALRADSLFAVGGFKLSKLGQKQIDAAVASSGYSYAQLASAKGLTIEIVGHTDRTGNAVRNQVLSEKRAEAVKAHLVSKGLPADAIKTSGRGASEPITGDTCAKLKGAKLSACLVPDRRVDITVAAEEISAAPVAAPVKPAVKTVKAKIKAVKAKTVKARKR